MGASCIARRQPTRQSHDPQAAVTQPIRDVCGDPVWSRAGRFFAFIVSPGGSRPGDTGAWLATTTRLRRHLCFGWVMSLAWTTGGDLLVFEAKPNISGVPWQVNTA